MVLTSSAAVSLVPGSAVARRAHLYLYIAIWIRSEEAQIQRITVTLTSRATAGKRGLCPRSWQPIHLAAARRTHFYIYIVMWSVKCQIEKKRVSYLARDTCRQPGSEASMSETSLSGCRSPGSFLYIYCDVSRSPTAIKLSESYLAACSA